MKIWIERALAGVRWVWEKFVPLAKAAWAKLRALFDTVVDPPPRTIRFWFWSFAALIACVWVTFAFTNSWFYRPTAQYFTSIFEDGDVFIPEHTEDLEWARGVIDKRLQQMPSVATPAIELPSVEVVCQDMSDTPHCEELPPKSETGGNVEVSEIPPPVAKPRANHYKLKRVRKHQPYVTYWGY